MRPVRLTIKGINSFIDEQSIDFTRLTSKGLFGIFGPTGSGKSTILDGMTLALYGKVARDSTNYINTNLKVASVKYEFEIMESRARHYIVEREFKRNADNGINNTVARVMEVIDVDDYLVNGFINNGNITILGDKVKAVNEKCVELLGLSCDDFTRTVVLPQGKFSEFLKLEGRPKRDMLERIFDLSRYGDEFSTKLSKNIREQEDKVKNIVGNLLAYEDLTYEILQKKRQEKIVKETELKTKKIELDKVKKEYETKKAIWELQCELNGHLDIKKELSQKKELMQEAKEKASRACDALTLKSYIDSLDKSSNEINGYKEEQMQNKLKLENLYIEDKCIVRDFEEVNKEKNTVYPQLIVKKSKVDDGIAEEKKIYELEGEVKELREQYSRKSVKYKQCNDEILKISDKIEKLENTIKSNEVEIGKIKDVLNVKDSVVSCMNLQEKLDDINKKTVKLKGNIETFKGEINKQDVELGTIKSSILLKVEELKICENKEQEIKKSIDLCEKNIKLEQTENIAEVLKKQLVVGAPCPVCGVIHLENNDSFSKEDIDTNDRGSIDYHRELEELRLELERISINIKETNKLIGDFRIKEGANESSSIEKQKALKEYLNELEKNQNEINVLQEQIEIIKNSISVNDIKEKYDEIKLKEQILRELDKVVLESREDIIKLQALKTENQNSSKIQAEDMTEIKVKGSEKSNIIKESIGKIDTLKEGRDSLKEYSNELNIKINKINSNYEDCNTKKNIIAEDIKGCEKNAAILESSIRDRDIFIKETKNTIEGQLKRTQFKNIQEAVDSYLNEDEIKKIKSYTEDYEAAVKKVENNIEAIDIKLKGNVLKDEEWSYIQEAVKQCQIDLEDINKLLIFAIKELEDIESNYIIKENLQKQQKEIEHKLSILKDIEELCRGKKFVGYVATQQLEYISKIACKTLASITSDGYGLKLDCDSGKFVIIDNKNGGALRDASTLSGGETFLVSLALALALSSQIQLKGTAPLGLFFLDEGFGTLDNNLLDIVLGALESIQKDNLTIGLITHVEEIKERVPVKLIVEPAESGKGGSKVTIQNS